MGYFTIWMFPKNRGTPKWMVCNGKPYENGWFGGPPIVGNTHSKLVFSPDFLKHQQVEQLPVQTTHLVEAPGLCQCLGQCLGRLGAPETFFLGREIWRAGKGSENCRFGGKGKMERTICCPEFFFKLKGWSLDSYISFWGSKHCKSMSDSRDVFFFARRRTFDPRALEL